MASPSDSNSNLTPAIGVSLRIPNLDRQTNLQPDFQRDPSDLGICDSFFFQRLQPILLLERIYDPETLERIVRIRRIICSSVGKASTERIALLSAAGKSVAGDELQIGSDDGVTVSRYTVIRIIMRIREAGLP